jgi:carbon-monoxide dehydrogenase medium subunit
VKTPSNVLPANSFVPNATSASTGDLTPAVIADHVVPLSVERLIPAEPPAKRVVPLTAKQFTALAQAAASLGTYQIRCRATLGGNICNASPAADMLPSLIALGAKAKIVSKRRERWLPLEELFSGPGQTNFRPEEILAEVQIPHPPGPIVTLYAKHSIRNAMDMALAGVAVSLCAASQKGICSEIRIALGAVGPVPSRARRAEDLLRGQKLDERIISRAAEIASEEVQPITDIRASAEYRREMVRVLTRRSVEKAWKGMSGKDKGR